MKNFRKVLALVLVVATLFSFASMAGAKTLADYTDADKVTTENYKFAVDVLSGLEILNGYEDDTFKPTNTITRAEMAKMIAVLSNAGDDNVDKLYAAACEFADVDKVNDWFASYVSYCAYTGIVAGRSATTFDPYGKVTGLETAKMLLVVLGMDAAEQGYVGANWKINVLRDAQNFGLLEGFAAGYSVDEPITREEAAMMMLNALKSQVIVGVLSENIVKVTNALYNTYAFITLKDAEHEGFKVLYGNVIVAPITLAEALYEGRLDVLFVRDCYGRPTTQWTLTAKNGKVVFEGMLLAAPVVATDYKGEMDLDEVLEDEVAAGYQITAFRNGFVQDFTWSANKNGTFTELEKTIGKGVLVEVYVRDNGAVVDGEWVADGNVTIVIIDTFIGKINYIDLADDQFSLVPSGVRPDWQIHPNFQFDNDYGFTTADEGKTVLYWICNENRYANVGDNLHDIEIIEPTVAVVTDSTKAHGEVLNFVADGKTYEYAFNFNNYTGKECEKFGEKDSENDRFGFKNDIYTDKYGYVMYHNVTDTWSTVYAVAQGNSWVSSDFAHEGGNKVVARDNKANLIYFREDTTPVTEETSYWFNLDVLEKWEDELSFADDILMEISYDEYGNASIEHGAFTYKGGVALNKGKCDVDAVIPMINSKTQIIVRVPNYTDKGVDHDYKYFNGLGEVDASYVAEEMQYFTSADGRYITYMFVDAVFAKETNRAFILSEHSQRLVWSEGIGHIIGGNKYNAVVNGEAAIVVYDDLFLDDEDYPVMIKSDWVWVGMTIDGLPVWAKSSEDTTSELEFCTFCEIKIVGGVMTWICCTDDDGVCEHYKDGDNTAADDADTLADLLGVTVDEETVIIIAWPTTEGYTFEKITEADFYEFTQKYGWAQVKAYAQKTASYCSELVLVVEDIGDDASDWDDDNITNTPPFVGEPADPEVDVFA